MKRNEDRLEGGNVRRDIIATFLVQILVLVAGLYSYRLAKTLFSSEIFATYALIKRNVALLLPLYLTGFSVAIPRFIAYEHGEGNFSGEYVIFSASWGWMVISSSLLGLTLLGGGERLAFLLFGDRSYVRYFPAIFFMITGTMFHSVAYSFFRGRLDMGKANLLQLIDMGIIPVLAFFSGGSLNNVLMIMGVCWLSISFAVSILIFAGVFGRAGNGNRHFGGTIKQLLIYGIQRVPGDFGMAMLLSVPPIVVAHLFSPTEGGYTAFGVSLLRMTGALFAPVGLIFLPLITQLLARNEMGRIIGYVVKLLWITFSLTILGVAVYWLMGDVLLNIYLGRYPLQLLQVTRIFITAAIGYNVFVVMRSVIDAYYLKGINSLNIMIAVAVLGLIVVLVRSFASDFTVTVWLLSVPIYFLGLLTLFTVWYTIGRLRHR